MNGWAKYFLDGGVEEGRDIDISQGKASWSKGRLDGMFCTRIQHNDYTSAIYGIGSYWQSDDYEADLGSNLISPRLLTRRIQKKLEFTDHYIYKRESTYRADFLICRNPPVEPYYHMDTVITPDLLDHWFVVELDVLAGEFKTYMSKERI
jgi:hypothetical protein